MPSVPESGPAPELIEPEVAAFMRRWGVSADDARGMLELEKAGIRWATPIVDESDHEDTG